MADQLSDEMRWALADRGITATDEVSLHVELERHLSVGEVRRISAYALYRLTPAAARRWKCKYRLMFGDTYVDCQSVVEAYAAALLALMSA
jgi:hypothetical protein